MKRRKRGKRLSQTRRLGSVFHGNPMTLVRGEDPCDGGFFPPGCTQTHADLDLIIPDPGPPEAR